MDSWIFYTQCECVCVCVCVCGHAFPALCVAVHVCLWPCTCASCDFCAESVWAGTLSIKWAGGLGDERTGLLLSRHPSMLRCSPVSPFQDRSLGSCQDALRCFPSVGAYGCIYVCVWVCVCTRFVSEWEATHAKPRWVNNAVWESLFKTHTRSQTDKCILCLTHTHTHTHKQTDTRGTLLPCMTCSCLSPPIPSSFRFTGGRGKKRKREKHRRKDSLRRETRERKECVCFDGALTWSRCCQ